MSVDTQLHKRYRKPQGAAATPTGSTNLIDFLGEFVKNHVLKGRGGRSRYRAVAYRVIPVRRIKGGPQFKVLFEWWDKGTRQSRAIPRHEWPERGFREDMSLESARQRRDILNAQERLSRQERRRQACLARRSQELLVQSAYFPEALVMEFERYRLPESPKTLSHWKVAREIITSISLLPRDWAEHRDRFYREMSRRCMSPSYVKKVLPLINLWGSFQAAKQKAYFEKIPPPRGKWADEIAEAYYNKEETQGGRESEPLTPEMLEQLRIEPERKRWLAFTVWFGLRPSEVDLLIKPSSKRTWWLKDNVLAVYQTKLKGVSPDERTKRIPVFLPEQQALVADMSLPLCRPSRNDIVMKFPTGVTLYGGRKNFVALMKSKGQRFENVSVWLGHTDLDRTYKSYFNKREVKFDPFP